MEADCATLHQAESNNGGIHQEQRVSMGRSTNPTHPRERQGSGRVTRSVHSWALRISSSTGQKTQGRGFWGRDYLGQGRPSAQGL